MRPFRLRSVSDLNTADEPEATRTERHASWAELFFDLVAVAGVAALAHVLGPEHCLVTGVVATVAVSLSLVVKHGSDPLPDQGRWLLCGAVAAYFTLGVVTGVASHSSDLQRTISRVITGIVVPLLLGLFATGVAGRTLVVCLALVVLAHLWFERRLAPAQPHV